MNGTVPLIGVGCLRMSVLIIFFVLHCLIAYYVLHYSLTTHAISSPQRCNRVSFPWVLMLPMNRCTDSPSVLSQFYNHFDLALLLLFSVCFVSLYVNLVQLNPLHYIFFWVVKCTNFYCLMSIIVEGLTQAFPVTRIKTSSKCNAKLIMCVIFQF